MFKGPEQLQALSGELTKLRSEVAYYRRELNDLKNRSYGLDQMVGESPALFKLLSSDYPAANDITQGDGVNTGGFRFNAPTPTFTTAYVFKVDYNLTNTIQYDNVGIILQRQGRLDEALTAYRDAAAWQPAYAEGHFGEAAIRA